MLKERSREPTSRSTSENNLQLIPDPWELPSPELETESAQAWQPAIELHPLIGAGGNPAALQLPSPKFNSIELLLQDWLKLRTERAKKLAENLREALGLLYWMETMAY
jgi:hypothetical protein